MNIYKEALTAVQNGGHFKIDFKSRSFTLNGKRIIKDGKPVGKYRLDFCDKGVSNLSNTLRKIEQAYIPYRYSVPGMKDSRKAYFWAPSYYKMHDEEQLYGEARNIARFRLEFRVLIALIKGTLYWDDATMQGWFWRSKSQPQLVILKEWVINNN